MNWGTGKELMLINTWVKVFKNAAFKKVMWPA